MKRVTLGEMILLNGYWVGHALMWNSLHPIVLPAILLFLVPDAQKNTYLGLLTFVGLLIAMIVQPLSGALSDRWVSRWGRRRPMILLGVLFALVFLALIARAGTLGWLVVGYLGLQISSNVAHGPVQGLLPDRVPREQLGIASGLRTFMEVVGMVAAFLLAGRLLDPGARYPIKAMVVIASVLAASAAVTLLGARETPTSGKDKTSARLSLAGLLQIDFRAHTAYWWLIGTRFTFLLGIYGIQMSAQYYLRDVFAAPNPAKLTGDLLAAITLALIAFAPIGGWVTDRLGAKPVMLAGCVLAAAGCLLLPTARTPAMLVVYGAVAGAGIGLFLTANWALANRLAPAAESGKFLGLMNLATAGSGAMGRLEGPFIDLLNHAWPGEFLGYRMVFVLGAVCALASIPLIWRIRTSD